MLFGQCDQHCFSKLFKLNVSSISHQQATAEHWDLTNRDFQSKDVASGEAVPVTAIFVVFYLLRLPDFNLTKIGGCLN
jgi:hypothetical protein